MVWVYLTRNETPAAQRSAVWAKGKRHVIVKNLPHHLVNITGLQYASLLKQSGRRSPVWKTMNGKRYRALPPIETGSDEQVKKESALIKKLHQFKARALHLSGRVHEHYAVSFPIEGRDMNKKHAHSRAIAKLTAEIHAMKRESKHLYAEIAATGASLKEKGRMSKHLDHTTEGLDQTEQLLDYTHTQDVGDQGFRMSRRMEF